MADGFIDVIIELLQSVTGTQRRTNQETCREVNGIKQKTIILAWHWDFKFLQLYEVVVVVQLLSHVQIFVIPWTAVLQASLSFNFSWNLLKLLSIESVMPSIHLVLCLPLSSCLQTFPASGSFLMSWLFTSCGQNIRASASASVLLVNIQDWSPLGWTGLISYSPRDSQESSPTPQFKSINSSALSFLYSPTLQSIHDYWKKHNFD